MALGIILTTSALVAPERLYPWLGLTSGLLLAGIGASLLVRALRGRRLLPDPEPATLARATAKTPEAEPAEIGQPALVGAGVGRTAGPGASCSSEPDFQRHTHPHHDHAHHHHRQNDPGVHDHGGRAHSQTPIDPGRPVSRRTLVAMGFAGGLVPSPSALLVLLGAIALGRAWFGLVLVIAYGLGMAGTLTGAGLLLLRARGLIDRHARRHPGHLAALTRYLPAATAMLIVALGVILAGRGAASI
jgi:ABC-type nickel/cobalt efflux system permease component RcnA